MEICYSNIKRLRLLNGWSQDELARKMGYTDRSSIAKIESGKVDLSLDKIEQIAKLFNVSPADLVGWKEDLTEENAEALADLLMDPTLLEYVKKLLRADPSIRGRVFGYIDGLNI